jgi:hypothetical protein
MPIYLMSIRVLLSVEFCVALKTYLKGAPFYNASHSGKYAAVKCRAGPKFLKAGFWPTSGLRIPQLRSTPGRHIIFSLTV